MKGPGGSNATPGLMKDDELQAVTEANDKNWLAVRDVKFWSEEGDINGTSEKFKNLVQQVGLETAAEGHVVVRGGIKFVPREVLDNSMDPGGRRVGVAAEGPVRIRGGTTFDPGTRRVGTAA